jgi:hypothetical protein
MESTPRLKTPELVFEELIAAASLGLVAGHADLIGAASGSGWSSGIDEGGWRGEMAAVAGAAVWWWRCLENRGGCAGEDRRGGLEHRDE